MVNVLKGVLVECSIDFLDLKLRICGNRIDTTLFRKATATNNVLHFDSFHPAHLCKGIPKGQFLRLRRNCSRTEDFINESRQLTNRFRERGYPKNIISGAFTFSMNKSREDALKPRVTLG
ncbi:general transcription factor IIH subunit 5 isoform X1 [Dendrobates tinctorius]|uniref:general transcription factor IIH subunit 5 isoform X1 n=1 Tax=Dendrobates tinctorius TaxID=92724 RepID=UPI003CCA13CD